MIGRTISHYRIVEKLGEGGMGVVYKAEDITLQRPVALKFLSPYASSRSDARERFLREAKAASSLQQTNICTVHEIGETDDGQMFIVMDYYEGESLKSRIGREPLSFKDAVKIALDVAEGLVKAHERDIIHRDIKPANIIITNDGVTKIVDFGLAKLGGTTQFTQVGKMLGTTAYMSPEQLQGQDADQQSDIWSLGVLIYEMLSARLPFDGQIPEAIFYSVLNQEPTSLHTLRPDIPPELERIVKKALQKNKELRYGSISVMRDDLVQLGGGERARLADRPLLRQLVDGLRKPIVFVPSAVVLLALCGGAFWLVDHLQKVRWAREEALPEIERLREKDEYTAALTLLGQAERYIPDDLQLRNLVPKVSRLLTVESVPPGGQVYIIDYPGTTAEWELLGTTPIHNARIPQSFMRWKILKEGFEPLEGTDKNLGSSWQGSPVTITTELSAKGSIPSEMVKVPGGNTKGVKVPDFLIDRYEVTNRQFKAFVDSGGYRRKEFWKQPFVQSGRILSWDAAMAEFVDATGQHAPGFWELGDYPKGQDDYPVRGVSWYEAAAFAEAAGKALPTRHHWVQAAGFDNVTIIIPNSNFSGRGPAPVGSYKGIGPYGTSDMAGNVKEWCWNELGGMRIVSGGSWSDPQYMFTSREARPAFFRGENCGFRCVKYLPGQPVTPAVFAPLSESRESDLLNLKPCSDEIFRVYKSLFSYERGELAPSLESRNDSNPDWTLEKVSVNAAYGGERLAIYLYLPKKGKTPHQTVIYCPGSAADFLPSLSDYGTLEAEICTKSGRAFIVPVYKGMFERHLDRNTSSSQDFRDLIIMRSKDLARAIDYLESRPELDTKKLAYDGLSSGAVQGLVYVAVETRLKLLLLISGGLEFWGIQEVNPVNFVPHIKIPVLMMNGMYDNTFPVELNQKAAFRLLGTPEKDKIHRLYETGHDVWSTRKFVKDYLDFLDRYFGPAL